MSYVTPLEFVPGFPQTLPHVPFPFADIILYPLAVMNHSGEYDYMPSPVGLPSKSWNLGVVSETPKHFAIELHFPSGFTLLEYHIPSALKNPIPPALLSL